MKFLLLLLALLPSFLHANESLCQDPLVTLLAKKQSTLSDSLLKLLDRYELKQFQENDKNWHLTINQLCKSDDCECLINQYQQRNLELSKKSTTAKAQSETKIIKFTGQDTECGFSKTFPEDMIVIAAGGRSAIKTDYRIGEKGEDAAIFKVVVNSPKKPVALILGTYNAAIWDISWTEGTKIEAAFVMGYHTQAVSGLPKTTPISTTSIDNKYECGSFTIDEGERSRINPLSNKLFHKNTDSVYYANNGYIYIGDSISDQDMLFASEDTPIASLHHADAPLREEAGINDAISKGILRAVTENDLNRWIEHIHKNQNLPKVATEIPNKRKPYVHNGYVILKPLKIPEGLYGGHSVTFFLENGVPMPEGNLGHSTLYDFNTMTCKGAPCNINNFGY